MFRPLFESAELLPHISAIGRIAERFTEAPIKMETIDSAGKKTVPLRIDQVPASVGSLCRMEVPGRLAGEFMRNILRSPVFRPVQYRFRGRRNRNGVAPRCLRSAKFARKRGRVERQ
ncbi:hypothetical protein SDC9_114031 [bioreactor metagenome]|uniref:Uncharacterized protein n=1 Tax=bioreactor metagenome TaxID=1076179 RepID=A0A645BZH0_9ZZZZ